jgi:hypothetical protein
MTPSGIEPATFRLLAQCLNQLRHREEILVYDIRSWRLILNDQATHFSGANFREKRLQSLITVKNKFSSEMSNMSKVSENST